jgi:hypothetical protein
MGNTASPNLKPNPEKLCCISIVICDEVYRDETSKKLILVGTFSAITASAVPCTHGRMSVLFTLTNGKGEYALSLSVEHEQSGQEVFSVAGPLKMDDPLAIVDMNLQIEKLVFPKAGKYWIVLKADGEVLQQRPIWVTVR